MPIGKDICCDHHLFPYDPLDGETASTSFRFEIFDDDPSPPLNVSHHLSSFFDPSCRHTASETSSSMATGKWANTFARGNPPVPLRSTLSIVSPVKRSRKWLPTISSGRTNLDSPHTSAPRGASSIPLMREVKNLGMTMRTPWSPLCLKKG